MPARDSHSNVANKTAPRPPLGDVCRGSDSLERDAASVADQVASAACLPLATGGRPMSAPPLFARIREPSTHPRYQSSSPAAFS